MYRNSHFGRTIFLNSHRYRRTFVSRFAGKDRVLSFSQQVLAVFGRYLNAQTVSNGDDLRVSGIEFQCSKCFRELLNRNNCIGQRTEIGLVGNRCEVRRTSSNLIYLTVVTDGVSITGYLDYTFRQIISGCCPIRRNLKGNRLCRRLRTKPILVRTKNECRSCRRAVVRDIGGHIIDTRQFVRWMEESVVLYAYIIARTEDRTACCLIDNIAGSMTSCQYLVLILAGSIAQTDDLTTVFERQSIGVVFVLGDGMPARVIDGIVLAEGWVRDLYGGYSGRFKGVVECLFVVNIVEYIVLGIHINTGILFLIFIECLVDAHISVHAVHWRIDGNNKDTCVFRPDSAEILATVISVHLAGVVGKLECRGCVIGDGHNRRSGTLGTQDRPLGTDVSVRHDLHDRVIGITIHVIDGIVVVRLQEVVLCLVGDDLPITLCHEVIFLTCGHLEITFLVDIEQDITVVQTVQTLRIMVNPFRITCRKVRLGEINDRTFGRVGIKIEVQQLCQPAFFPCAHVVFTGVTQTPSIGLGVAGRLHALRRYHSEWDEMDGT